MALEPGAHLYDRYRILDQLGQGGFGAVYLATDEHLHITCAVKENLNLSPESERQFRREAKLLASLRHPNLPRVTHHFILGRHQYLVMDYVEGEDLAHVLTKRGPLPEAQVLTWAEQIGRALEYLHSRDPPVIHRDIKPANIKITPAGEAVLVDFGIAKASDPGQSTATGARGVTSGFAPPEQYGLGNTDARSDVYALAATLYCLLTGERPPDSMDRLVGAETLVPPKSIRPDLSPHVGAALTKGLNVLRELRFADVVAFRRALTEEAFFLAPAADAAETKDRPGGADTVSPQPAPPRRHGWSMPRTLLASLAAAALLVSVIGAVGARYGLREQMDAFLNRAVISPAPQASPTAPLSAVSRATSTRPPEPIFDPSPTVAPTHTPTPEPQVVSVENAQDWRLFSTWQLDAPDRPKDVSPDGRSLAVVQNQGVTLFDSLHGDPVEEFPAFLVGRRVLDLEHQGEALTILADDEVIRWGLTSNRLLDRFPASGRTILASPGGDHLAVEGKYVSLFDLQSKDLLFTVGEDEERTAHHIAFSPDDSLFAVGVGLRVELWDLARQRLTHRLRGHGEPIQGLAFTPDGSLLVSASGDAWDVRSGELTAVFDSSVAQVAISPNGELAVGEDGSVWSLQSGERLARIPFSEDQTARLWFTEDGLYLLRITEADRIESWSVDPNAARAATSSTPESADRLEREPIHAFNLHRLEPVFDLGNTGFSSVTMNPDASAVAGWGSSLAVVASGDSGELLAEIRSSNSIADASFLGDDFLLLLRHAGGVERWEFALKDLKQEYEVAGYRVVGSPDGRLFGVQDKYIQVIDALSGRLLYNLGSAHGGQDFRFSPDGEVLAIAAGSGVGLWDMVTGRLLRQLAGHGPATKGLNFSADGTKLVSASGDVWDVQSGRLLAAFDSQASRAAVSSDGALIVDDHGNLWDGETSQYLGSLEGRASNLSFTPDDRYLLWQSSVGRVKVYAVGPVDDHPGAPRPPAGEQPAAAITPNQADELALLGWWGQDQLLSARADNGRQSAQAFGPTAYRDLIPSPDGWTLSGLHPEGIDLLDPLTGERVDQYSLFLNPSTIQEIGYLGEHLLLVKSRAGVERWDLSNRRLVQRYDLSGDSLAASPDGRWFALQLDNRAHLVQAESGEVVLRLPTAEGPASFAFSPDSNRFAVARGPAVAIWDLESLQRTRILRGHAPSATGLAFSPEGSFLVSASGDIWDLDSGDSLAQFESRQGLVALSPDGRTLVDQHGGIRAGRSGDRLGILRQVRATASDLFFTSDGSRIVWRTAEGDVYVWGPGEIAAAPSPSATPDPITSDNADQLELVAHAGRGRFQNAVWSPDDEYIALNSDQNAVLYETQSLNRIGAWLDTSILLVADQDQVLLGDPRPLQLVDIDTGHEVYGYGQTGVHAAAFSPDGQWLAISGAVGPSGHDDGLALIDRRDGLVRTLEEGEGRFGPAERVQFTPDSERLVVSHVGAITLWDVESGTQLRRPIIGNRKPASISADGEHLVYLADRFVVENLEKGGVYLRLNADGTPYFATGIDLPRLEPIDYTFTRRGSLLVFYAQLDRRTFDEDVAVIEWDISDQPVSATTRIGDLTSLSNVQGALAEDYRKQRPQRVPSLGLGPSETLLYSFTADGVLRLWDFPEGHFRARTGADPVDLISREDPSNQLALLTATGTINLVDTVRGETLRSRAGDWQPIWIGVHRPSVLMVLEADGRLRYLDTVDGQTLQRFDIERARPGDFFELGPRGWLLATMQRWSSLNRLLIYSTSPDGPLLDLGSFPVAVQPRFSPDGVWVAIARRRQAELWNVNTGEVDMRLEGAGGRVGPLAFSPHGDVLISGSGEIWSLSDGSLLRTYDTGQTDLAVRTNGEVIMGRDGRLWELSTGKPLGQLNGLRRPALDFYFSNDGSRVIWHSGAGIVEVWAVTAP